MGIYIINEQAAREAHNMNSMRDYKEGSATSEYNHYCEEAERLAERQKEQHPDEAERIDYLLDLYERKLAAWMNESFRIESMCPSILVSGGGNFPVRKKEKQNARRRSHDEEREKIDYILKRIRKAGTGGIKSGDENAIEKLELKVETLEAQRDMMKEINAYYRKHKTLTGCEACSQETAERIMNEMKSSAWRASELPFASYSLTNTGAEIRRLNKRIEELKAMREAGNSESETEIEGLKIVENADIARIQLVFDGKPEENVRNILKKNGFRWSPSQGAWQRNLNDAGKYAVQRVLSELKKGE